MKRSTKQILKSVCSFLLCAFLSFGFPQIALGETGSTEYQFAYYSSNGQEACRLLFTYRTELNEINLFSNLKVQTDRLCSGTRLQLAAICFPVFSVSDPENGSFYFAPHKSLTFQASEVFYGDAQEYAFETVNFESLLTISGFCCSINALQIEEDGDYTALSFGSKITSDGINYSSF